MTAFLSEEELREWFSFSDEHETYPFVEDEDANVHGYGHQDPEEFVAAVHRWDRACGALDADDEAFPASLVTHRWAVMDADRERFWVKVPASDERTEHLMPPGPVGPQTPGAFPVTCLWGQR